MGATVCVQPLTMLFGKWIVHMAHGDLINRKDVAYLRYHSRIRSQFMKYLAHKLPGGIWDWLGKKLSESSAKKSRAYRADQQDHLRLLIRDYARNVAKNDRCHFVITGHFHILDEFNFDLDGTTVKSINLGSWLDPSKTPIYRIDDHGGSFIDL